jgi:hypothetical protein
LQIGIEGVDGAEGFERGGGGDNALGAFEDGIEVRLQESAGSAVSSSRVRATSRTVRPEGWGKSASWETRTPAPRMAS